MSSSAFRDTVHLRYMRDGLTGYGEGAPIVRYKEFPEEAKKAIDAIVEKIAAGDPHRFDGFLSDIGVTGPVDESARVGAGEVLLALADELHRAIQGESLFLAGSGGHGRCHKLGVRKVPFSFHLPRDWSANRSSRFRS